MLSVPEQSLHRTAEVASPAATSAIVPVARMDNIGKRIDDRAILRNLSTAILPGEFVALLGTNGAGKTTLLKMLALLSQPTTGQLHLFGQPAKHNAMALRRRIGLIGHQSMLYGELSARENLAFFGKLYGLSNIAERADRLLTTLGLKDRADDLVKHYSRGMVQRATIARALLHDPDLLLADEPFTGLDAISTRTLENLFRDLHRAGKTIILVHHDLAHALRLAERAIVLHRGRCVLDRTTLHLSAEQVMEEVSR